jgi:uncharacterized SAM-binding protein YcdF (DUF218 family)
VADRGGRVVAVLGYSRRRDDDLHPVCAARLVHAEGLAADARAVVVTGWSRRRSSLSEADRMREAWRGPDVPLVCDSKARTTADNAATVAAAAVALGADEVVVVTSRWHRPRAALLLRAALRGSGVRLTVAGAPGRVPPLAALREAAFLLVLPLQLRRARRRPRLALTPAVPGALRPPPRRGDDAT